MYTTPIRRMYSHPNPAQLDAIERAVITHFKLKPADLRNRSRKPIIAHPRKYYFYLAATLTKNSQEDIAARLGFDRTMVTTCRQSVEDQLPIYDDIAETVNTLRTICGAELLELNN